MMNSKLKIALLACFSFLVFMTSCSNEDISVDDFTDETMSLVESETRSGKLGCYELVYPVTVDFPDGSSQEVSDGKELRGAIRAWKEANLDIKGRPHLAFPYDIITEDGKLITVENRVQKLRLKKACKFAMGNGSQGSFGEPCFRVVYPITVLFPDGTTTEVESRKNLKLALRVWKMENPDSDDRPIIEFPITVMFEDETTQVVSSKEELMQLKADCRG